MRLQVAESKEYELHSRVVDIEEDRNMDIYSLTVQTTITRNPSQKSVY